MQLVAAQAAIQIFCCTPGRLDAVRGLTICGQAVVKEVEGVDYQPDMKLGDY